jgi:hypothetical protein
MSQGPIDLGQLHQARAMQQANKHNAVMNIALQMFLQGKAQSITGAFTLAEQFIQEFERRQRNEVESQNSGGNHPRC